MQWCSFWSHETETWLSKASQHEKSIFQLCCHENITFPDLHEKEIIAFYNPFSISLLILASIRLILKEIDLPQNWRYLTAGARVPTLPWQKVYNDTCWKMSQRQLKQCTFDSSWVLAQYKWNTPDNKVDKILSFFAGIYYLKSGIIHNVSSLTVYFFAHWFIASATAGMTVSRSDVLGLLC